MSIFGKVSKKSLIRYIILLTVFVALIATLYYVLSKGNGNMNFNNDKFRTDKEPISSRFPNLGDFNSSYWKADIIGKNNRTTVPAPSSYWMKGFVVLSNKEVKVFKSKYKWTDMEHSWKPSLDTEILNEESLKWSYSEDFNNYIKSANYVGKFYLDLEKGIVFFDVQS